MKKITFILAVFLTILSGKSFSQEQSAQTKSEIKPALLVIDIQNAYLKGIPENDKEIGLHYINGLIELFRENGFPIIRIYHLSEKYGPTPDTEQFEFPTSVLIKSEDTKVVKTYPDGFNKTDLDKILKEKGCNTVFLCGLSAVGCVLSTWIGAHNHDYKAFMVKNAIMSHNSEYTDNVEEMFDAVSWDMVSLIVENSGK